MAKVMTSLVELSSKHTLQSDMNMLPLKNWDKDTNKGRGQGTDYPKMLTTVIFILTSNVIIRNLLMSPFDCKLNSR